MYLEKIKSLQQFFKEGSELRNLSKTKRVMFLCVPATAYGGAQQYLYRIVETLKNNDWNNLFVFPDFKDSTIFRDELKQRGANTFVISDGQNRLLLLVFILLIVCSFRPNLLHLNGYVPKKTCYILLFKPLLKLFFNVKICLTQHLELFSKKEEVHIVNIKNNILLRFSLHNLRWPMPEYRRVRFYLSRPDLIIFVNEYYRKKNLRCLNLKSTRVMSIVNGVDITKYRPKLLSKTKRNEIRDGMNISNSDFLICGVGNLVPQKRFDLFIRALSSLAKQGYPVKGLIVGIGPLEASLKDLALTENISQLITFTGYRSDIPTLLNISDCFLMTSDDEGLPYALLEARACGLPSVATSVGGICEVINNGIDGLLVQAGNLEEIIHSIKILADNPDHAHNMQIRAQNDIKERFSLRNMQEKTLEAFQKLV